MRCHRAELCDISCKVFAIIRPVRYSLLPEWNNFAASYIPMRLFLLFVLGLTFLTACKKEPQTKVFPPPGGSWTINGLQKTAQLSEITDRNGFQITFSDKSGSETLSFLLRSRPETGTTFIAAKDTSLGSNVAIRMESAGLGFHATTGVNADVTVEVENGKLHFTGKNIRVKPDSGTTPETNLDFDLKEY